MSKRPIDLERIRKALAWLDRLAREHPELLGESTLEEWEDVLKGELGEEATEEGAE